MKKIFVLLILGLTFHSLVFAQQFRHIGPCSGSSEHGSGICYGYAMGRAAWRSSGDSYCNPLTFHPTNEAIDASYFQWHELSDTSNLQSEDIMQFSTHVAYVTTAAHPVGNSTVDSYSPITGEQTGVTLNSLKNNFGNWTGFWRRKQITVTVKNDFNAGNIKIDSYQYSSGPQSINWWASARVFEAINYQEYNNATRIFNQWSTPLDGSPTTLQISIYPKSGATYMAYFDPRYNITFSNYVPGGSGGTIKVAGLDQTSPYTTTVMGGNSISAEGIYQVISRIEYTFSQWNDGPTTNPRTFTPGAHTTYTANFTSKPLPPDNVWAGGTVGDYVHVTWTEHPNQYVTQYQIWRRVKDNGQLQDPELIATLNRGTTSYIDYDFLITSGYTNDIVYYDVRSVFVVQGQSTQYSDPDYTGGFFATNDWKLDRPKDGELAQQVELGQPKEYRVSSYPNPFNPSTTIRFDLPEASFVRLKVFDLLGQVMAVLVEEQKAPGSYSVTFDASNLPSGVYLYLIEAGPYVETRKMLLLK